VKENIARIVHMLRRSHKTP